MDEDELREANRLMWMVKGRLIPETWHEQTIRDMVKDYTKRLWYNEEAYHYEKGFDEAYKRKGS